MTLSGLLSPSVRSAINFLVRSIKKQHLCKIPSRVRYVAGWEIFSFVMYLSLISNTPSPFNQLPAPVMKNLLLNLMKKGSNVESYTNAEITFFCITLAFFIGTLAYAIYAVL